MMILPPSEPAFLIQPSFIAILSPRSPRPNYFGGFSAMIVYQIDSHLTPCMHRHQQRWQNRYEA